MARNIVGSITLHALMAAGAIGIAVIAPTASAATVHDARADFSASSNPNGVWSFGSQYPTLGGGFALWTNNGVYSGLEYWNAPAPSAFEPLAMHNPTAAPIYFGGSVVVEPGQLTMHPGPLGEYAILRFTAPATGTYSFIASCIGQDYVFGTTTDVHVLKNSSVVFSDEIAGFLDTASTGTLITSLLAGDTLDLAVGFGSNGNYFGDHTGVDFTVELVPAPGAASLLGIGGLLAARRRR